MEEGFKKKNLLCKVGYSQFYKTVKSLEDKVREEHTISTSEIIITRWNHPDLDCLEPDTNKQIENFEQSKIRYPLTLFDQSVWNSNSNILYHLKFSGKFFSDESTIMVYKNNTDPKVLSFQGFNLTDLSNEIFFSYLK